MEYPLNRRKADDSYRAHSRRWELLSSELRHSNGALYGQTSRLLTNGDLVLWRAMAGRHFWLRNGCATRDDDHLHGSFGGRVRLVVGIKKANESSIRKRAKYQWRLDLRSASFLGMGQKAN
ncbi:MAG: hypothetical protein KGL35_26755 [Bradyrhizobium sp.]|nr:hypothetical protein [Pseudomonadota bacterium]MDE2067824.1 hypothetical protein [Bradyrhizobium sp.]MDE2472234.1 hypothetical protein [Bradyrhizobium sp.]